MAIEVGGRSTLEALGLAKGRLWGRRFASPEELGLLRTYYEDARYWQANHLAPVADGGPAPGEALVDMLGAAPGFWGRLGLDAGDVDEPDFIDAFARGALGAAKRPRLQD